MFAIGNYTARESFAGLGAVNPWADFPTWNEVVRSCVTANEPLIGIRAARAACGVPADTAPSPASPYLPGPPTPSAGGGGPDWLWPAIGGLFLVGGLVLWEKRKKR